jgi:16S rRNA (uracil1498-N3)-methyltransferase
MQRFFAASSNVSEDKIIISDKDKFHHIKNVLRLKKQDEIIVFDELGNECIARIDKILRGHIILQIKEKMNRKVSKRFQMTFACAVPKKSNMDDIIDKLTQLGVDRIIPLRTKHVVVKLDNHKEILRYSRWSKIAQNASQQSQRNTPPTIDTIKDLEDVLQEAKNFDAKLIATLKGERRSLKDALAIDPHPHNLLVVIGPEGDFSDDEVKSAKHAGFIPVSLGDLVLRVETAAVAVASYIRLYF